MAEIPEGHVVHKTRRRVRVRIPSKRHDRTFFANAVQELSQKAPHANLEVNPATASILIHSEDPLTLLATLGGNAPFSLSAPAEASGPSIDRARQLMTRLNDKFSQWTGGASDARTYIFLALLLSAAYQATRGDIFAPAATLLWYAGEALRLWTSQTKSVGEGLAEAKKAGAP